jgi:hypothetical protein
MGNHKTYLSFIFMTFFFCCTDMEENIDIHVKRDTELSIDSSLVKIEFSFDINSALYQKTNFGDPPQLAVWIKNPDSTNIRTVWVTHRAGKNDWKGKIECPVALPFWESESGIATVIFKNPRQRETFFDAVSGATPKGGRFSTHIRVPQASVWKYYIEVNVSADYNKSFPYWSKDGLPDSEANGQPSVVYSGQIVANDSSLDTPRLIGRTEQRYVVDSLSTDLNGITTANRLIENIKVKSQF